MLKIINPIEEVKKVIPKLDSISDYGNIKTISYNNWDNRMKTIETKNLKKYGRSLSWSSLSSYFHCCIIETNIDYQTINFNEAKYKLIREYVISEEFNNR